VQYSKEACRCQVLPKT